MTEVSALLTQVAGALTSGPGLGVLAVGAAAAVGFALYVFRDDIALLKQGDRSLKLPLVQPPRLSEPSARMDRAREKFWDEGKSRAVMTAFQGLGLVAIAIVALVFFSPSKVGEDGQQKVEAEQTNLPPKAEAMASMSRGRAESPANNTLNAYNTPFCEVAGSLSDGFIEFCANGSAVRMEVVRLRFEDRFVIEPLWIEKTCGADAAADACSEKNALSLVDSESHAAPFSMGAVTGIDTPLTSSLQGYDGLFLIGAATDGLQSDVAEERRRALYEFAELQVCGVEGPGCELATNVLYSATARFTPPDCAASETAVPGHFQNYCARANALQELQRKGARSADEQLGPELLVLGIKIDDLSPSRQVDMFAAATCFMANHQSELRMVPNTPVLGGGEEVAKASGAIHCQH